MNDLGSSLRAWRDRADPVVAGVISKSSRRRVAGLRRGELANLAGISPEYVARLEQGKALPSAQVCVALSRALQLSRDEASHLRRLAGFADDPDLVPTNIPDRVKRVLDQLAHTPVGVYDARWRLLDWNSLFAATFGDPSTAPEDHRNAIITQFELGHPRMRQTEEERSYFEHSLVADLRATSARYPRDTSVGELISRLRPSERFRELWALRAVAVHEHAHKTAVHPDVGEIALDTSVLITQPDDLRIVVMTARPGTDARSKLDILQGAAH